MGFGILSHFTIRPIMTKHVLIPLAEGCEELEAVTIIDLLRRADIKVTTASLEIDPIVTCSRGTRLVADSNLADIMDQHFDLIALPGGLPGADILNNDPHIHQLITNAYQNKRWIAAICAAPRVLISNKTIELKKITAYPHSVDHLDCSSFELVEDSVVCSEQIITANGPGSAIDFSLQLIEVLLGKEARADVEKPLNRPSSCMKL